MLYTILSYLNNWFTDEIYAGEYTIENGGIVSPFLKDRQYFRIVGSMFNDGVHQYPNAELKDETFDGAIWALKIPPDVIKLSEDIQTWQSENKPSAYTSESFGGYSYSKATNSAGTPLTWREVFSDRLTPWRKIGGQYEFIK